MVADTLERPAGWVHHPGQPVQRPLDLAVPLPGADGSTDELHLVFSDDGLYIPALVRRPPGPGPFPAVICLHGGSGGLGVPYLRDMLHNQGALTDRLLAEGFLVCVTEGRCEQEDAYATDATPLDHHDVVAVFRYLRALPAVNPARVGLFGASHGGELQLKLIAALGAGPAALVPCEPAVIEFLGLRYQGVRKEANLQFQGELDDAQIDLAAAMGRIAPIDPGLPILVVGRDGDHLQGLFRKLYELLRRAGKNAHWQSYDHPEHAYQFGPRRGPAGYAPDPLQAATIERVVAFLKSHVYGGAA
ncbi:MAG TPA: hypothetical protein PKD53_09350 [Chloroflexaceae bacterium]|nr:hypothetical protein [Chloroflexaceae bacterium]